MRGATGRSALQCARRPSPLPPSPHQPKPLPLKKIIKKNNQGVYRKRELKLEIINKDGGRNVCVAESCGRVLVAICYASCAGPRLCNVVVCISIVLCVTVRRCSASCLALVSIFFLIKGVVRPRGSEL